MAGVNAEALRKWRRPLRRVPCSPRLEKPVVFHGGDQPEGELPDPKRSFPRDTHRLRAHVCKGDSGHTQWLSDEFM